MNNDWVVDIETFPNAFTIAFEHVDWPFRVSYEISEFKNQSEELLAFFNWLHSKFARLVTFNGVGFDYPVIHQFIRAGRGDAPSLYAKAMAIIQSQDHEDRWAHQVKPADRIFPVLDLYLIFHFDNQARRTSLKVLEFNMRADSIEDLPFPVGTMLTREQIVVLRRYNAHDVAMTKKFYHHSKPMIDFRKELSDKYHHDFTNHNDTKIGKTFFQMELEKAGVPLYDYGPRGRTQRQTKRPVIRLVDAILPWIRFTDPAFQRVLDWMKQQSITETKAALAEPYEAIVKGQTVTKHKPVAATVGGIEFVFGTGGIHASVEDEIVESDDQHIIVDLDVTSMYPNIAIQHGFYPEHLGESFVGIYKRLFEQRKQYPKKSAESAMLKLALNGVYGDSNNKFSVFYDPLYTMRTTLNGQMFLCLLAEQLATVPGLRLIQANTDGVTFKMRRTDEPTLKAICEWWEEVTKLTLERVNYARMCIRDSNAYIAVREDGTTKRKGPYEYDVGWHQDAGGLVIPKVVEKVLVEGASIRKTVEEWPDLMDFMLRVKVPKTNNGQPCHLMWGDERVQNITRYLVTTNGKQLTKWLPPLPKDSDKWRPKAVESGWLVEVCNRMSPASSNLMQEIQFDYYVAEVEKLVMGLK